MSHAPATARPARPRARRPGPAAAAWVVACLLSNAHGPARAAQDPNAGTPPAAAVRVTGPPGYRVRAGVVPPIAEIGQRLTYRAWVSTDKVARGRWLKPEPGGDFTWGEPEVSATVAGGRPRELDFESLRRNRRLDPSAWQSIGGALMVEIPLQAFALGRHTVPGIGVEIDDGRGPRVYRLPAATLEIVPVIAASDSNADYRPLHDPFAAPWWERVPWTWVVLGALALAAAIALVRWWRRRRRAAPVVAAAEAGPADPRAAALAALGALRALHLPEHGRFAEHAFRLGQILRVFLEATTGVARPGDTTPELVAHLRQAGLEPDELARLSGLLRVWDRVKFARDPFTLEEAVRAERSTEMFVRQPAVVAEKVA